MKISVAAYGFIAISIVFVTIFMSTEARAQVLDRPLSLQVLASQLNTPEAIAKYMWRHFQVESDRAQFGREEKWQSPEEFLTTRRGDCEDFALFAQQVLKLNGISSFLLNVYSDKTAHTVCVFKEGGFYHVIDGTEVIRTKASSLDGLISEINPFWRESAIVRASESSDGGKILARFGRS